MSSLDPRTARVLGLVAVSDLVIDGFLPALGTADEGGP